MFDEPLMIYEPPPHYYYFSGNANAFAAAPACVDKKDGPLSGLAKFGCDLQHDVASTFDSGIKALTPARPGSQLDAHRKAGGDIYGTGASKGITPPPSSKPGGGTGASKKCSGCNAGDIGCELGKLSCEFFGSIGDATGGSLDFFSKYWPFIAGGGALIVVILLLKR